MSAGDFLAMGGYGFYVWSSYIVAVVAIAIEIAVVRTRLSVARRMVSDEAADR